jgi:hypothetical protein
MNDDIRPARNEVTTTEPTRAQPADVEAPNYLPGRPLTQGIDWFYWIVLGVYLISFFAPVTGTIEAAVWHAGVFRLGLVAPHSSR